jgi:hypothetical protein
LRTDKIKFLQSSFQKFPRFQASFFGAAFWLSLVRAKKNVPGIFADAQRFDSFMQFVRDGHS